MANTSKLQHINRDFSPNASIVLVGIRGAGKRSLGFIAATHLDRRFVSEGLYFEKINGVTKAEYLQQHGREEFSSQTLVTLQQLLDSHAQGCVIECGISSLVPGAQELLLRFANSHPVIYVMRDVSSISQHLHLHHDQAVQLKELDLIHRSCSNFEFYNLDDDSITDNSDGKGQQPAIASPIVLRDIKVDFQNFVTFITRQPIPEGSDPFSLSAVPPEQRDRSHVRVMKLSSLLGRNIRADELECGEDALEICIDTWHLDLLTDLSRQVSLLRRRAGIPIILSLDTSGLSPPAGASTYAEAVQHAFRLSIEYVSLDMSLDTSAQRCLLSSKGQTKAVADHEFRHGASRGWLDPDRLALCETASALGFDIVRLTQTAVDRNDNDDIKNFILRASSISKVPVVAYNHGYLGRRSKVFNRILTPISNVSEATDQNEHGELTVNQITTGLFACFEFDPLHFYVLGQSVFFSRAPPMYRAAFQFYGMKHDFSFRNLSSFQEVLTLANDPFFGGSAISFPFKEAAFRACKSTSSHASVIGSINTILPLRRMATDEATWSLVEQARNRNRAGQVFGLYGDNSDWYGMYTNILRKLSPRNTASLGKKSAGLILGAGGSARSAVYALLQLGCKTVYLYNRTHEKAVKVADHFNAWCQTKEMSSVVKVLEPGELRWPQDCPLPIIIAACVPTTTSTFSGQPSETFGLPEEWLGSPWGGVVLDVSYNPPETPFIKQVQKFRRDAGRAWEIVSGIDLVYEQALLQFEQMTGYRAPRWVMQRALQT